MKLYKLILTYKEILLLIILPIFFFIKIVVNPQQILYPAQDILAVYAPLKNLLLDNLHLFGKIPLWNPYAYSGMPFLAYTETSIYYPLSLLFLVFPVNQTFGYIFLLDTILTGIFTYLYARSIQLEKISSLIAALLFMFSGSLTSIIFPGHTFVHSSICWIPLILYCYEKLIQESKIGYVVVAVVSFAMMLFAGFVQLFVYTSIVSTLYFYYRYIQTAILKKRLFYSRLIFFAPFFVIFSAAGISAIQLIPSFELSHLSTRSNGVSFEFASDFSLAPKQLLSFLLPHFFGTPYTFWGKGNFWSSCGYMGISPFFLSMYALFFNKNKYIIFYISLLIFSLFFSFGNYSFLFPFFYKFIPLFNLFRVPARFLYFYSFSFAIISGFGVSALLNTKRNITTSRYLLYVNYIAAFLGVTIVALVIKFNSSGFSYYQKYVLKNSYAVGIDHVQLYKDFIGDLIIFAILCIVISTSLILFYFKKITSTIITSFFTIIIIFDLWTFGLPFIQTQTLKDKPIVEVLQQIKKDHSTYRILDLTGEALEYTSDMKLESITGINPSYLETYKNFVWLIGEHYAKEYDSILDIYKMDNITVTKLLNVKYIISNDPINNPHVKLVLHNDYYLYAIINPLPRTFTVPDGKIITNANTVLATFKNQQIDVLKSVIFDKNPSTPLLNAVQNHAFTFTQNNPDQITLAGTMQSSGYLFISEIWYPGWKAYDNGKEITILKGDYIFKVLYLPKGNHTIKLLYKPTSYEIGKSISIAISIFLLSCLLWQSRLKFIYLFRKK